MLNRVIDVRPLDGYQLQIGYENGEVRVFDVSPYLDFGLYRALRDSSVFRSVRPSFDSVEWSNGADICPELLYERSVPLSIL